MQNTEFGAGSRIEDEGEVFGVVLPKITSQKFEQRHDSNNNIENSESDNLDAPLECHERSGNSERD